jgi:hypothetical protein
LPSENPAFELLSHCIGDFERRVFYVKRPKRENSGEIIKKKCILVLLDFLPNNLLPYGS